MQAWQSPTLRAACCSGPAFRTTSVHQDRVLTLHCVLRQGNSGVSLIQGFNTEEFSTRFAGEIHGFACNGYVPRKMERRMDSTIKYIMVAGKKVQAPM